MHIIVSTYPRKKLFEGKVDTSKTVEEFINDIAATNPDFNPDGRSLIVDRNQDLHRILIDDASNRHYNGRMGEIFRITDGSTMRYRIVSNPVVMSKDKGKAKEKRVTGDIYASAYENTLTMLGDRGCDPLFLTKYAIPRDRLVNHFQTGTISNLTIPGLESTDPQLIDSRGRAVYVFFLSPEDDIIISRRGAKYRQDLIVIMNEVIKHHNTVNNSDVMPQYDVDDLSNTDIVTKFADKFEIIMVHNNPFSKSEYNPGIKPKFYQAFPVQNLSFVVTQHVDQPQYILLDPDKDRQEIRNIYSQNGRTLASDATLGTYSLRDNVRLMLV